MSLTALPPTQVPRCSVCGAFVTGYHSCGGTPTYGSLGSPIFHPGSPYIPMRWYQTPWGTWELRPA